MPARTRALEADRILAGWGDCGLNSAASSNSMISASRFHRGNSILALLQCVERAMTCLAEGILNAGRRMRRWEWGSKKDERNMYELSTSRWSRRIVALALCSAAIAASPSTASARSHRGAGRHVSAHKAIIRHFHRSRHFARASNLEHAGSQLQANVGTVGAPDGFGGSSLVSEARRYLGGSNPTGRRSLWCARFMNVVLQNTGHRGTGSDMANSFVRYGQRISGPQVGAIAVMGRRGGGHVGIVTGVDARGNPIIISGNSGNRVREAPVSHGRIYAYVTPD